MLGDKLQQRIAVTLHSNKCFVCTGEFFGENICIRHLILCNLFGQQNSVAETDFPQNSPVYTKQFVAASVTQFVIQPVHKKLFVAVTCCSNMWPSVFQPLGGLEIRKKTA